MSTATKSKSKLAPKRHFATASTPRQPAFQAFRPGKSEVIEIATSEEDVDIHEYYPRFFQAWEEEAEKEGITFEAMIRRKVGELKDYKGEPAHDPDDIEAVAVIPTIQIRTYEYRH